MSKRLKNTYRILAWFFFVVIAAGSLSGCSVKYGPPPSTAPAVKYGPPTAVTQNIQTTVPNK